MPTLAAQAAARTESTYLAAQYAQIRSRWGTPTTAVAVGHSIPVIAWQLLSTGEPYNDLGNDYFDKRRNSTARQRLLVAQLGASGGGARVVTGMPAALTLSPRRSEQTIQLAPRLRLEQGEVLKTWLDRRSDRAVRAATWLGDRPAPLRASEIGGHGALRVRR